MELLELMYCMIIFVVPMMGIVAWAMVQLVCNLLNRRDKFFSLHRRYRFFSSS